MCKKILSIDEDPHLKQKIIKTAVWSVLWIFCLLTSGLNVNNHEEDFNSLIMSLIVASSSSLTNLSALIFSYAWITVV